MDSIDLLRDNLTKSTDRVLARVEEMRDHCFVPPTAHGGGHTLWVLGHLAYIEALVTHSFMRGKENPLEGWRAVFDGEGVPEERSVYPPFEEVLATCRAMRAGTLELLDGFTEDDLDRTSARVPAGHEGMFGTYRLCLQMLSDHWYMHRGQLADARRSAQVQRMWF